jgi:hypothetical protein
MATRQPPRRREPRRFVIEPGQRYFLTDKEAADLAPNSTTITGTDPRAV